MEVEYVKQLARPMQLNSPGVCSSQWIPREAARGLGLAGLTFTTEILFHKSLDRATHFGITGRGMSSLRQGLGTSILMRQFTGRDVSLLLTQKQ